MNRMQKQPASGLCIFLGEGPLGQILCLFLGTYAKCDGIEQAEHNHSAHILQGQQLSTYIDLPPTCRLTSPLISVPDKMNCSHLLSLELQIRISATCGFCRICLFNTNFYESGDKTWCGNSTDCTRELAEAGQPIQGVLVRKISEKWNL